MTEIPELPKLPAAPWVNDRDGDLFTTSDMRCYGAKCLREGMERAAVIAADIRSYDEDDPGGSVAAAIRTEAAKEKAPTPAKG